MRDRRLPSWIAGICALVLSLGVAAEDPRLEYRAKPEYPSGARIARIAGTVVLEYSIDASGAVAGANVVSGHPILAAAARSNLATWRFAPPAPQLSPAQRIWGGACLPASRAPRPVPASESPSRRVTYDYGFSNDFAEGYYDVSKERVSFEGIRFVSVISAPFPTLTAADCPGSNAEAPSRTVSPGDWVSIERSGCYGTCPSYIAKVFGDGRVEWTGAAFVEKTGQVSYRIPKADALRLLHRFRQPDVWGLCGEYSRSVTDNPTVSVVISADGQRKAVSDYAASSPKWFRELQIEIERVADTHALWHGEPATEPLLGIQREYLYKPGRTVLMRAAAAGDLDALKRALSDGGPVDAVDASGWTALMYAAASFNGSGAVEELLRRGADPKHVSANGDTVLMAASLRRVFEKDLARLGGNINAQNRDGVTALMLIASGGEQAEIDAALKAGADPNLLDHQGRPALHYLEATSCLKSLVRGDWQFWTAGGPCKSSGDKDLRKALKRLGGATRLPKR